MCMCDVKKKEGNLINFFIAIGKKNNDRCRERFDLISYRAPHESSSIASCLLKRCTVVLCRGFDRESLINYRRGLIAFSRGAISWRDVITTSGIGTPTARMHLWMRQRCTFLLARGDLIARNALIE